LLGVGDYKGAIKCFDTFFKAEENELLAISRNYSFPACLGASETWLALGEFDKARHYAQRLHDLAAGAPENTYLALSHRLLAEIAIKEEAMEEADLQITNALNIVENSEVPLAAWRAYGVAEKLHYMQGNTRSANVCQYKKQHAIRKLADSLPDSDPLRERLWSLIGINVPVEIDAAVQPTLGQADFNTGFVDAA
jgi:tetratricopeptide (TPR) repeat protein